MTANAEVIALSPRRGMPFGSLPLVTLPELAAVREMRRKFAAREPLNTLESIWLDQFFEALENAAQPDSSMPIESLGSDERGDLHSHRGTAPEVENDCPK